MIRGSFRSATAPGSISRSISTRKLLLPSTNSFALNKVKPTPFDISQSSTRTFSIGSINRNQLPPNFKPEAPSFGQSYSPSMSPFSTDDYTKAKYMTRGILEELKQGVPRMFEEEDDVSAIETKLQEMDGKLEELRGRHGGYWTMLVFALSTSIALGWFRDHYEIIPKARHSK